MTSPLLPMIAPVAAALATVAAFAAVLLREPPLLAGVGSGGDPARPPLLDRLGSTTAIRSATGGPRLHELLEFAGGSTSAERLAGVAAVAAAGSLVGCLAAGGLATLVAPLLVVAVLRAPTLVASRAAGRRRHAIDRDVPLLLDVLSLASFAGLPPPTALRRAVSAIEGPLADVLSTALTDVDLGARWRDRLERVAEEAGVRDLGRVVALLVRTESIGAGASEPVAILADELRAARRAAASERARKAPVQMLFPLVFLVLPAFLLLTVVPVLVATLGSIR
jgi:pilus assembly protein TadC